jgi:hypothetical protein
MVKKEKVNYGCLCGMNFGNRIDNYNRHINKIKPCIGVSSKILSNPPEILQNPPEILLNPPEIISNIPLCVEIKPTNNKIETHKDENKPKEEETNNKFCCPHCFKNFSQKFNLNRHLDGRCKFKPNETKTAQNETKSGQENNNDDKLNYIIKQLNELKNENEKLKKQIKRTKKTTKTINNNNIVNNIVNNNQRIVNFNNMNLEEVDKKLFIQPMINGNYQGKQILLKTIENIYINEDHPEYHNIIITDKNRGYVKVFNNGKWKTDNIDLINNVIDGIVFQSKNILIELKQQYMGNNRAMDRLNTSEKYVNLCDLEYLEDLKDAQENDGVNNIALINRCKEFRGMVYDDTINLFHDNKKTLLKTQKNNDKIIEI